MRDALLPLWVRITVCWRHGHQPWSEAPFDYCRNCGKANR